ncbi:hypothetical protein IWX64_003176 [Arthrobacter sp. CAN_A212]
MLHCYAKVSGSGSTSLLEADVRGSPESILEGEPKLFWRMMRNLHQQQCSYRGQSN